MPVRQSIEVNVPVFKGAVGKRAASEEYYDFAQWLVRNRYWNTRIKHVHVHSPKYLVLAQRDAMGDIILGELDGYEDKMQRLQKLYTKGFDKIGYDNYREYDLRFDGQVVGRK
jgi:cell division protein FtsQ